MDISKIGENIKALRKDKKIAPAEFSEMINLTRGYVSSIEKSQKVPRLETLIKIANALDALPSQFIDKNAMPSNDNSKDAFIKKYLLDLSEEEYDFLLNNIKNLSESMLALRRNKTYLDTPIELEYVGEIIKKIRTEKHLSQNDVLRQLQISPTHYSAIERGERPPTTEILYKISSILEISPDCLLTESFHGYKLLLTSVFDLECLNDLVDEEYKFIYNHIIYLSEHIKLMRPKLINKKDSVKKEITKL